MELIIHHVTSLEDPWLFRLHVLVDSHGSIGYVIFIREFSLHIFVPVVLNSETFFQFVDHLAFLQDSTLSVVHFAQTISLSSYPVRAVDVLIIHVEGSFSMLRES